MYTVINYKSKKALKEAVAAGVEVRLFAPGLGTPVDKETVCGPWYPEPHKWYASVTMKDGLVIKVK